MAKPPSKLDTAVAAQLRDILTAPDGPAQLNAALRLLAKWKAQTFAGKMRQEPDPVIGFGPFAGMLYQCAASEGGEIPRRLGCYEASLAPVIEKIIARGYKDIVDVGSAEGYYAVGLALRMPDTIIHAYDADPTARQRCADLAQINGVADRIRIDGMLGHPRLQHLTRHGAMILCDIEGAEDELLDPDAAPGLRQADILVEVHEAMKPGLADRLAERFKDSHDIARIGRKVDDAALPDWAEELSDIDRLILLWEWRAGPTPWFWMQAKSREAQDG